MTLPHLLLPRQLGGQLVDCGFELGALLQLERAQLSFVDPPGPAWSHLPPPGDEPA